MKKLFIILVLFTIMSITINAQVYTNKVSIYEYTNDKVSLLYSENIEIPVYLDLKLKKGYYGSIKTYFGDSPRNINFTVAKLYKSDNDVAVDVITYDDLIDNISFVFNEDYLIITFEIGTLNSLTWIVYRL